MTTLTTTTAPTAPYAAVLRGMASLDVAASIVRDACDLPALDVPATIDRIVSALDNVAALDARPFDRGIVAMFDRVSHQTRTTAEPTDDTATFVRAVIVDVAHALDVEHTSLETARDRHVAAGDGGIVFDPITRRWQHVVTRPAARRTRSRSGQTTPVVDRSRLDNAERLSVIRADEASRLTGIPLLGRIDGRTPREVTPRLGGVVTGVTVTDAAGNDVTAHYAHGVERGADAIGRTLRSHEVIRLADRPRHRLHRETWDADGTRIVWEQAGTSPDGAPYWRMRRMTATAAVVVHAVREQGTGTYVLDVERDERGQVIARRWVLATNAKGKHPRPRVWRHYAVRGHGPRALVLTARQARAEDQRRSHVARDAARAAQRAIRDEYAAMLDALDVDQGATIAGRLVTRVGSTTRGRGTFVLDAEHGEPADGIPVRDVLRALTTSAT